jgi:NADPH-dependent 2,4-dienoyl-CoA reductase/sulfur reductase-like enzyme
MQTVDYLIIGGGMTAAAAANAIREVDPKGTIIIISAEGHPPYKRPPLSKKLWQGKSEDTIWCDLPAANMELILNRKVVKLEPHNKRVIDDAGRTLGYKKLLLATGGATRTIPSAPEDILYFRTLDDYHKLRSWTGKEALFGILGGGFIGSEVAVALATIGEQVTMVFQEGSIGGRVYPEDVSLFISRHFQEKGIKLYPNSDIQSIEKKENLLIMHSKDGQVVEVDHIVAGLGIIPNTDIAQAAGVTIAGPEAGRGIIVDEQLRTNIPGIYAAGDVATFTNRALQRQMRVEHEDNANSMGRVAGFNMAGQATLYQHQPYFYSDIFKYGYEAVGELDPRLSTFADWEDKYEKGVIYYLKDDRIRGVLLWNTWDQVDEARKLIAEGKNYTRKELTGLLPR